MAAGGHCGRHLNVTTKCQQGTNNASYGVQYTTKKYFHCLKGEGGSLQFKQWPISSIITLNTNQHMHAPIRDQYTYIFIVSLSQNHFQSEHLDLHIQDCD